MSSPRILRFGVFELDLAARELRKRGVRMKLQDQPFRVLEALLEKPGEIVTREELKERLWAHDEFVEFDKSVNTAVQKIRQALGDSAESPRFLETIPRTGYRFVASIHRASAEDAPTAPKPSPLRWRAAVSAAVLALGIAIGLTVEMWMSPEAPGSGSGVRRQLTFDSGLTYQPALSADGALLAYASDRAGEGGLDLWIQQVGGGNPVRLTADEANDSEPAFSPDGTRIVFRSDRDGGGVYSISALGNDRPRLVAKEGRRPRYSPDGKLIAYWAGSAHHWTGQVYVVEASGGEPRLIAEGRSPVWSPDSRRLLFPTRAPSGASYQGSDFIIADWGVFSLDGDVTYTNAFEALLELGLEPTVINNFVPEAWLRGDDSIVFTARQGDSVDLWRIRLTGGDKIARAPPLRLTAGAAIEDQAAFSASGQMAFASRIENANVWSIPVDADRGTVSGPASVLTKSAARDSTPSLSRDGKRLAFASARAGTLDIWVKELDTGAESNLTNSPLEESWSLLTPDGSLVAYQVPSSSGEGQAYVLPFGGGLSKRVCGQCSLQAWFPDGASLLVMSALSLRRLSLDGSAPPSLVYRMNPPPQREFSSDVLHDPSISPDGNWMAFHILNVDLMRRQIHLMPLQSKDRPAARSEWIAVTDGAGSDGGAEWSPDGSLLYFLSDRDGFRCIWAQRLDPGTMRPVEDAFGVHHAHLPTVSMSGLNPGLIALAIASDKIAFTVQEYSGNIWMTDLPPGG